MRYLVEAANVRAGTDTIVCRDSYGRVTHRAKVVRIDRRENVVEMTVIDVPGLFRTIRYYFFEGEKIEIL